MRIEQVPSGTSPAFPFTAGNPTGTQAGPMPLMTDRDFDPIQGATP